MTATERRLRDVRRRGPHGTARVGAPVDPFGAWPAAALADAGDRRGGGGRLGRPDGAGRPDPALLAAGHGGRSPAFVVATTGLGRSSAGESRVEVRDPRTGRVYNQSHVTRSGLPVRRRRRGQGVLRHGGAGPPDGLRHPMDLPHEGVRQGKDHGLLRARRAHPGHGGGQGGGARGVGGLTGRCQGRVRGASLR